MQAPVIYQVKRPLSVAISIVILAVLVADACADPQAELIRPYAVRLEGCPSELQLRVPSGFTRAISSEEIAKRDAIIDKLHSNPGRKARYSDVYLADWRATLAFPQISIASLGSLISRQGQLTENDWKRIKKEILGASQSQRDRWVAQHIEKLRPGRSADIKDLKGRIASVTADKPNSVVALGTSTAVINGQSIEYHSAAKGIFSQRCFAYIVTSVNAARPGAVDELVRIVSAIELE